MATLTQNNSKVESPKQPGKIAKRRGKSLEPHYEPASLEERIKQLRLAYFEHIAAAEAISEELRALGVK